MPNSPTRHRQRLLRAILNLVPSFPGTKLFGVSVGRKRMRHDGGDGDNDHTAAVKVEPMDGRPPAATPALAARRGREREGGAARREKELEGEREKGHPSPLLSLSDGRWAAGAVGSATARRGVGGSNGEATLGGSAPSAQLASPPSQIQPKGGGGGQWPATRGGKQRREVGGSAPTSQIQLSVLLSRIQKRHGGGWRRRLHAVAEAGGIGAQTTLGGGDDQ
uniref:Uncharacterized protein n=1 Tax=Oryza nivara TaxID=4536 RepID=A0A0E0J5K0_ORYNI